MPELPEAELARQQLQAWVRQPIDAVKVFDERALHAVSRRTFCATLRGATLQSTTRHGKHIFARMSSDRFGGNRLWWVHLGMSGRLVRRDSLEALPEHARWAVRSGDHWVGLRDPRIFGKTCVGVPQRVRAAAKADAFGPDAFNLPLQQLSDAMARTGREVKVALMDQHLVAGLGNIQAAEALYLARIDPRRVARELSTAELDALCKGICATLRNTLRDLTLPHSRGVTRKRDGDAASTLDEVTYVSDGGASPFSVYGKEGEPCPRCERSIERIVQAGRSTFFCPGCQC